MLNLYQTTIGSLSRSDCFELLKILTGGATAYIAWRALQNWKHQSQANKKVEFLDKLNDFVFEFIDSLADPISTVFGINIAIDCYEPKSGCNLPNGAAINYIESNGEHIGKALNKSLEPCALLSAKIQSLLAKGKIFEFENYEKCQRSCLAMVQQYWRIQAVSSMISSVHLNWENDQVQSTLTSILTVKAGDLRKTLDSEKENFLSFIKESYASTYK